MLGPQESDGILGGKIMVDWNRRLRDFLHDERRSTAIEYAIIAILCSVSIIAGLTGVREGINGLLDDASNGLQTALN